MTRQSTINKMIALLLVAVMLLPLFTACTEPLEEGQIAVEWHMGRITSSADAKPDKLLEGEEQYSYSDVIHLPKAGTQLTFCDLNDGEIDTEKTSSITYVISHWIEEEGKWVLEEDGDHYAGQGSRKLEFESYDGNAVYYTYVSTFDNEYVRLCYRSGQTEKNTRKLDFAKVYLEETKQAGTLAQNASQMKRYELVQIVRELKQECYFENLEGLTVYCLGDSYFDDSAVKDRLWVDLLEAKYGITLKNFGVSGSTVANCPGNQDNGGLQPGSPKASNPMCLRIKERMPKNGKPDIILFDGGRNDFSKQVPLGTIDSTSEVNFRGAINSCISQLKALYPDALIIGITCWAVNRTRSDGVKQSDFGNAMIEQCEYNGIPCINQLDKNYTGVDMDDAGFRSDYCKSSTDISHLNAAGQRKYMHVPEEFISKAYAAFLAGKQ